MHSRMKRVLKWAGIILGLMVAAPLIAVLAFLGAYWSVVWPTPGALAVDVAPGPLGASVNPFAATGGVPWVCGHDTPAATTPFGMVRLGPDTASLFLNRTGLNRSGYYYGDNKIIGFSHTRLVGADALEGGCFRVFPTVQSRAAWARGIGRFARFSHGKETAFPGYYAVWLPKDRVLVELTATPRVGAHRYTFQGDEPPHLLLDVSSALGKKRGANAAVRILPEAREIEGSVRMSGSFSGRYGGLDAYFVARFSQPFAQFGAWSAGQFSPGATQASGDDLGVDLAFDKPGADAQVELRLALSYVSTANARLNLEAEAAGQTFDALAAAARDAWETRLSAIRVEGGNERQRRIFTTALYHCFLMPTTFTDVNGEYLGFDRLVHKADGFRYFTDLSLWDTFRTVHPLYNLIAREDQRDMMVSLVEMAKAGGCLPRWPSGCGYTNCMFGTPADPAVAEAYLKGIRNFDVETAYRCMRDTALTGKPPTSKFGARDGLESYLKNGYCPSDQMRGSVAKTLEYAYCDFAISLLARELGHKEDADLFAEHARFYRNLWNPATQYFQEKDSQGRFSTDFDPLVLTYTDFSGKYTRGYVEGSALQWRWSVPHDPDGLIALFSSRESFVTELDTFFAKSNANLGNWNPGPYYWQGNEPDIDAVYLFNHAGRPDLTQKWLRRILDTKYDDTYVGLDGNDDGGTLSAWYVFSALGFYPIAGTTRYELGAPIFAKAEVRLGDHLLTIMAENSAPENIYVQRVSLNGKPLERPSFTHDDIAQGGALRFEMGPTPPASPTR